MRDIKLNILFSTINSIPGIGPKLEKLFQRLVGERLVNLLWHLPYNIIIRNMHNNINDAQINSLVTLKIKVIEHLPSKFKRQPYKVKCLCGETRLDIIFFFARHPYVKSVLPLKSHRYVSGKLDFFKNTFQITHPSHIISTDKINEIRLIEPIYGLTAGINQRIFLKTIDYTIKKIPKFDEWIDDKIIKKYDFKDWHTSITKIHNPNKISDLDKSNPYRRRIAYDELFAHQLSISLIKSYNQKQKGLKFTKKTILVDKCIKNLEFKLTNSQKNAWNEIYDDLISQNQMVRLLQGDVGSGKTIIALLSMLQCNESGYQSILMAPTSILAQQHYENFRKILKKFNSNILILTGKDKGAKRLEKLEKITNGSANIIIGTHSLIQDDVIYNSAGLVVIDEQHRFGVMQRMSFVSKNKKPSILVMSATPIPRTLALATYGQMSESRIIDKPLGRLKINTFSIPIKKENELIKKLKNKFINNEKAFWVCPLVEESEELDLQAAEERFNKLKKIFNEKVLLIHGRLKEADKENIMNKFKNEDYNILVATTVIEVGIDIENATTIIIENAERYGLATLHQIRGRVGRNNIQSHCVLLYKENLNNIARKRIEIMKQNDDGFKIAEKDLKIRGPGELLGKKQSGLPSFKIADLGHDEDLLMEVKRNVDYISTNDPKLLSENGKKIKNLLYLFQKNEAIKTLKAG